MVIAQVNRRNGDSIQAGRFKKKFGGRSYHVLQGSYFLLPDQYFGVNHTGSVDLEAISTEYKNEQIEDRTKKNNPSQFNMKFRNTVISLWSQVNRRTLFIEILTEISRLIRSKKF